MRPRLQVVLGFLALLALVIAPAVDAFGRGGGRAGGGASRGGGGSFSRGGGGGSVSRSGGGRVSSPPRAPAPAPRQGSRPAAPARPSYTPPKPAQPPGRAPLNNGGGQLPSASRPQAPSPSHRPSHSGPPGGSGNFLGMREGAAPARRAPGSAGLADSGRLPSRADRPAPRPQDRANWNDRADNRSSDWLQRVETRQQSWNQWSRNRADQVNNFQQTRDQRWDSLQKRGQELGANSGERSTAWREHREELWDYRYDRAEEVWDDVRDYHDDLFDDHWWVSFHGYSGYGYPYPPPANPWWWWDTPDWDDCHHYVYETVSVQPVYTDYGPTNIGTADMATYAEPAPSPQPAEGGTNDDWLPLGVFALVQEEKGDPEIFMQLSISSEGLVGGAYENTEIGIRKPIAGRLDKESQHVAWRIGDNRGVACTTTLGNLTRDLSPVALCFADGRVENWLLVRLPEPPKEGQPARAPDLQRVSPPPQPAPAVRTSR